MMISSVIALGLSMVLAGWLPIFIIKRVTHIWKRDEQDGIVAVGIALLFEIGIIRFAYTQCINIDIMAPGLITNIPPPYIFVRAVLIVVLVTIVALYYRSGRYKISR